MGASPLCPTRTPRPASALPRPSHMSKQRHWECPCLAGGWPVIGHVSFGRITEALFPETTGPVHSFAVQLFSQRPAVTAEIGGCDSCAGRPETDRPSSLSWAGELMSCAGRGQEEWHAGRPCGPGQATWHHLPRDCLLASPLAAVHPRTAWGGWGAGAGQDSSQTCSPFRAHATPRPTPPCPLLLQPSPPDIPLRYPRHLGPGSGLLCTWSHPLPIQFIIGTHSTLLTTCSPGGAL